MTTGEPLLQVTGLAKSFGGLKALDAASIDAHAGQITALIGPNGAGKTTMFNCIAGELRADDGSVRLDGVSLDAMEVHERAAAGLGRTFQRLEVFSNMTVFENLQVAVEATDPSRVWIGLFQYRSRSSPAVVERVEEVLELIGLTDVARERAGDLSTGRLRLMELGRALCTDPRMLLLDEPASGLDAEETERFDALLRRLRDMGLGILLIEHDVDLVLSVSDNVYCLDFGRIIAQAPPDQIVDDPAVRSAYLGVENEEGIRVGTA